MSTLATYQGFPCQAVRFRRTRGWQADVSTVLLFAADFPAGFEFVTPTPGTLSRPRTTVDPDLRALHLPDPPVRQLPKYRRLEFAGELVMAEVDEAGREYLVRVNLFCVSIETVKRTANGSVSVVRAKLVDERFFYPQGFLRRWSFNRTDGRGNVRKDSVKKDGKPFKLGEIAVEAAGQLFGTPELKKYPKAWDTKTAETEFPRFGSARGALHKLSQEYGTEDLCLAYDGAVALWKPGEGQIGYAPDGKGVENTGRFPPGLQLYLQGTGQSRGVEAAYPADYVVIVGGLRIASVRLDNLDPVLVIEGSVFPLTEKLVRKLTKKKYGLKWLKKFVLAPQAYQHAPGLDPRIAQLFKEQAWRLWRIPGVEGEVDVEIELEIEPFKPALKSARKGPMTFREEAAAKRRATRGKKERVPGPNAHLLPLLERAETAAGRRLPVRVDSFRFQSFHKAMGPSQEEEDAFHSRRRLSEIRREVRRQAHKKTKPDPFDRNLTSLGFQKRYIPDSTLFGLVGGLGERLVSFEEFSQMLNRARVLDRIREISSKQATEYEKELKRLLQIESKQGGPGKALWDLAKEVVAFEKDKAASRDVFERPEAEAIEKSEELTERIKAKLRAIDQERLKNRLKPFPGFKAQTVQSVRNLPREYDGRALVHSHELGIVRTSELSGWVKEEGVPHLGATSFVPKSPLVTFGAVLRPRIDGGRATRKRPITGSSRSVTGHTDQSKVPSVLSDRESYYTAAFRRVAPGRVEQIPLDKVPRGEGIPVPRPDLIELVPLEGQSNKHVLDETAKGVAVALTKQREKVEAAKYSIARPWPVVCDGVVSGVEIAMRPNGKGFITTIYTGSNAEPIEGLGKTRERVRRGASDKALREGLLP